MVPDQQRLIAELGLQPHPEGGWYRETWRAAHDPDARPTGTAIYFLLEQGQQSAWHRVDATEIWFWHAGGPIVLRMASPDGQEAEAVVLGPDILAGQQPQRIVPAGYWQATATARDWVLVSCVVSPGFSFSGFDLADAAQADALDARLAATQPGA